MSISIIRVKIAGLDTDILVNRKHSAIIDAEMWLKNLNWR